MTHWDERYRSTAPEERSWTEDEPLESLELIGASGLSPREPVLDVGGGASMLVDALLERGYRDLTVLDVSPVALDEARRRVTDRFPGTAGHVEWIVSEVTSWSPSRVYRLWHDRAAFHFLTDEGSRHAYRSQLERATATGSAVILATFAPDGPETCSGLPVTRWDADGLARELGTGFRVVRHERREHVTPWGGVQPFTWILAVRE